MDTQDLEGSLVEIEELYVKATFNDRAKFSRAQKAAKNNSGFSAMAMFRVSNPFKHLKMVFMDFEKVIRTYPSSGAGQSKKSKSDKSKGAKE